MILIDDQRNLVAARPEAFRTHGELHGTVIERRFPRTWKKKLMSSQNRPVFRSHMSALTIDPFSNVP